jgi:hypothetical protein
MRLKYSQRDFCILKDSVKEEEKAEGMPGMYSIECGGNCYLILPR